jgi:RNA polymerase sigma factor (sigma-70 family)
MAPRPLHFVLAYLYRVSRRTIPAGSTDAQLLEQFAREGDEDAFAALLRRYGPLVMGVCRRLLRHEQDAEDVFQATFLVLARKASRVAWRASVGNWLHEVAYRLALRTRCEAARRRARECPRAVLPDAEAPPDAAWRELAAVLDEELLRLPERLRGPLLCCYLDGATQDEAARQLHCSLRTLRRRLEQGRELLRLRLTRRGITLSAALLGAALGPPEAATAADRLTAATARAARAYADPGRSATVSVSEGSLALAGEGLRGCAVNKLKATALCMLMLGVVALGTVVFRPKAEFHEPPPAPPQEGPPHARTEKMIRAPADLPVTHSRVRLGTLRFRGGDFALSPDETTLAVCRWDGKVQLLNATTGEEVRRLAGNDEIFRHVSFSADGRWLAAGSLVGTVHLWDVATWQERGSWPSTPRSCVQVLDFSPDSQTLAVSTIGYPVRLCQVPTGTVRQTFGFADSVAFSLDGKTIACATGGRVLLHGLNGERPARELPNPPTEPPGGGGRRLVAFSPDRKTLAVAGYRDGRVRFFDLTKGQETRSFDAELGTGITLAFSPDGRSLALSGGTLRLLDVASGKVRWQGPHAATLRFSKDGETLYAGADYVIRRFRTATGAELDRPENRQGSLAAVAVAPDGRSLVTAGADTVIRAWSLPEGRLLREYPPRQRELESVAYSPDGKWLVSHSSWLGFIELWDTSTTKRLRQFDVGPELWRTVLKFPSNQLLAASDQQGLVHLWDATTGEERGKLDDIWLIAFSSDGSLAAGWKVRRVGGGPGGPVSPIQVWDVLKRQLVAEWKPELPPPEATHGTPRWGIVIEAAALSPGGTHLAIAARRFDAHPIQVYDVAAGKKVAALQGGPGMVQALAYSHDGKLLAAGDRDGSVWLWDAVTNRALRRFAGHQGPITSLSFSADDRTLVSASADTTALIWDLREKP